MLRAQLIFGLLLNLLFRLLLFLFGWFDHSWVSYLEEVCRELEDLISRNGCNTKMQLPLFTIFLYVEILLGRVLQQLLVNFLEILLIGLLFLGNEYLFENFVNFLEVPHLNHTISLIDNQILQITKLQHVVIQELMQSTRCTDNYLRLMLPEDS